MTAGDAVISEDGRYRYALWRGAWPLGLGDDPAGTCLFVMLNPSTADASVNDPTIRRCAAFCRRWGFERLAVVNLFAYRATSPDELAALGQARALGVENRSWVKRLVGEAERVVAAWGGSMPRGLRPDARILELLREREVVCLGFTKRGQPRHPLYVRRDAELVPYDRRPGREEGRTR